MIKEFRVADRSYICSVPRRLIGDAKWYSKYIPEALAGIFLATFIIAMPVVAAMFI